VLSVKNEMVSYGVESLIGVTYEVGVPTKLVVRVDGDEIDSDEYVVGSE